MTATADSHSQLTRGPLRVTMALALLVSVLTLVVAPSTSDTVDAAVGGQASRYVSITPVRVLDTRKTDTGPLLERSILSVDPLVPKVIDAAGVDPLDVEAVAINLTITRPTAPGFLKTWPTAAPTPSLDSASAVNNRSAGENIANFSIVPVGANGRISVQSLVTSGVVIDVQGVFVRSTSSTAGRFVPLARPERALDTRDSTPVRGETNIVVDLTAAVGIPRTASAAVINLVATRTQQPGFLTSFPKGKVPNASNVNYPGGGHNIAGSAITQLDNGKLTVHASGTTDVIVDVIGYMTGETDDDSSSGLFVPFEPERHYDSRPDEAPFGSSPLSGQDNRRLQVAGEFSVPDTGVLGVATNLTMTRTDGPGFLVAYPKNPVPPNYSTVNSVFANHSIANHAIVALDDGGFSIWSLGRSDFVVDISGYFLDDDATPPTTPRRTATDSAPMPDVPQAPVDEPAPLPQNQNFAYLQLDRTQGLDGAHFRSGRQYFGWNPCEPITYAVNAQRATPTQMAALNQAIYDAEEASGFDFVYIGEVAGSLDTDSVDPRVVGGGGLEAMAVFAFSDPYATPILAGDNIGIGGLGRGIDTKNSVEQASGDEFAWIVRKGFAIADITNVTRPARIRATFAHEIAHMIGLNHVPRGTAGELMQPELTSQLTFGPGDKYGLWSIGARTCSAAALSQDAPAGDPVGSNVVGWVAD